MKKQEFNFLDWVESLPGEYKYTRRRSAMKHFKTHGFNLSEATIRRLCEGYKPAFYEAYKKIAMSYKKPVD